MRLPTVRRALDFIEERFGTPHPLAREQFQTDGLDLFLERSFPDRPDVLIAASRGGQLALRDVLIEHLRRIERDEQGIAARLFPFTRPDGSTQPRLVVVDPRVAFGRPVLAGTGIPTDILAERYAAGESVDELAEDYGCDRAAIEEAIRIEARLAA